MPSNRKMVESGRNRRRLLPMTSIGQEFTPGGVPPDDLPAKSAQEDDSKVVEDFRELVRRRLGGLGLAVLHARLDGIETKSLVGCIRSAAPANGRSRRSCRASMSWRSSMRLHWTTPRCFGGSRRRWRQNRKRSGRGGWRRRCGRGSGREVSSHAGEHHSISQYPTPHHRLARHTRAIEIIRQCDVNLLDSPKGLISRTNNHDGLGTTEVNRALTKVESST